MASAGLRWHALVYVLVSAFLATINFVFSPSVWWFLWVTGPWTMGLIVHAFAASRWSGLPEVTARPHRRDRRSGRSSRSRRDSHPEGDNANDVDDPDDADIGSARTRMSVRPPQLSEDALTQQRAQPAPPQSGERATALRVGQRVADRFVIERALGAGGMGEVYLAQDSVLGERVALKTIAASSVSPEALERFRREAQAARRVTHPNVVRIHDVGQDGALAFISMEYIEGETLGALVRRQGPLELAELQRIAVQVCDGLSAAHAAGVVHRDLKPDNILLDKSGQVRVIDFGLARLEATQGLTASGMVMGTPDFMSPEQVQGRPIDARSDLYALGCVLYQALTGAPPFQRESAIAIGMAHVTERPAPLRERRPDLPVEWEQLVLRALEKTPEQRFQTAGELRNVLSTL